MSLWYKQIEQVTFADVEAFCQQRLPEGLRLDYKSDFPRDLHKLVAAFANSLGGLILLGVEADSTTNEPRWPPNGMPGGPGIEERIVAICRDSIYPPVRPQISAVLSNPHGPGSVVLVVRIDESPEAPHAVEGRKRIYERVASQNRGYELADIDRIQSLLNRRRHMEKQRDELIQTAIRRARIGFANRLLPLRWASVVPVFPWADLCKPQHCRDFHEGWKSRQPFPPMTTHWDLQRVPAGSWALGSQSGGVVACSSLNTKGHFFAIERTLEVNEAVGGIVMPEHCIDYRATCELGENVFAFANSFYQESKTQKPGFVLLTLGLLDVLCWGMVQRVGSGNQFWGNKRFLDEEFRAERTVPLQEMLDDPKKAGAPLFEQVAFAFDTIPPGGVWHAER